MGTLVGAVLAYFGARADREATGQRELAARRQEWGRRFGTGLEYLGSDRARMRAVGAAMLSQLLRSDLASADDQDLGEQVLAAALNPSATSRELAPVIFAVDEGSPTADDEAKRERGES